MSMAKNSAFTDFFGNRLYILLAAITSIPVYLASNSFVTAMHVHEDEAVATAVTISFLGGIFVGRYIGMIWTAKMKTIPVSRMVGIFVFIVAGIAWIFFHADFPFRDRDAINLLLFWLPFSCISIAIGILIKMIRALGKKQLMEAQSTAAQSQSELHLLQSQLSPHFLFNTLNNLYGLSISQHEKIPPLLLKLSELLRYSVYEANEKYVPLKDELAYINNYIEFEKIRIDDKLMLNMDIEQLGNTNIKIAPMLLIVFIENAFKHSKKSATQQIFIDISLKTWGNTILFSVRNSQNKIKTEIGTVNKNSGFGLANVIKRLELLYPNDHRLDIQNDEDFYTVLLQVQKK
jgi:hypothetical protein